MSLLQNNGRIINIGYNADARFLGLAPSFSTSTTYNKGDVVWYNNLLYKFITKHVAGSWNSSDVELVNISDISKDTDISKEHSEYLINYDNNVKDVYDTLSFPNIVTTNGTRGSVVSYTEVTNASYKHIIVDCKENDHFYIKGIGGSTGRLWCFVDEHDVIVENSNADVNASNGLEIIAPCDGKLIVNTQKESSGWKPAFYLPDNINEYNKIIRNKAVIKKDIVNDSLSGYITTNGDVGSTVSYTVTANSNYKHCIIEAKKGDIIYINAYGGSTGRLWCLVDNENKIINNAAADYNATSRNVDLKILQDCKVVLNYLKSTQGGTVFPQIYIEKNSTDEFEKVENSLDYVRDYALIEVDVWNNRNEKLYITTNGAIGSTVSLTPTSSNSMSYVILDVEKNSVYKVRGVGGNAARLWCFVDTENKIVSQSISDLNTGSDYITLTAEDTGKLIINSITNPSSGITPSIILNEKTADEVNAIKTKLNENSVYHEVFQAECIRNKRITDNGAIGSTVSLTPVAATNWSYGLFDVCKGDSIRVRGSGGGTARLWCFIDNENKIVTQSISDLITRNNFVELTAPCDGKLIVNSTTNPSSGYDPQVYVQTTIENKFKTLQQKTYGICKYGFTDDTTPYTNANSVVANIRATAENVMFDIYDEMDNYIREFPEFITKYDAAELVDLEYPRYAQGISSGDAEYDETPEYKTYMYKFSCTDTSIFNKNQFEKKKLLIVSGIHGPEFRSCINAFATFIHMIAEPSSDLFDLFSTYDIYWIPCVNGYGIIHSTRYNANKIDINRNFGTIGWTVTGEPGDITYSGPTPDSEFETLLIEKISNYISPDFFIDHHTTPSVTNSQFYTETPWYDLNEFTYKSVVQCSKFFIYNYPSYFGTKFKLYKSTSNTAASPTNINKTSGESAVWFYDHNIYSCIIEIFGYINYQNGEYTGTGVRGDAYWPIMEYTFRNQLCNYLQITLS